MTLTDARTTPRRPLSDPDTSHDWTPQIDEHGMTRGYYCPDCLIAGAPVAMPCPDRVRWLRERLAVVEGERDGAREALDAHRTRTYTTRTAVWEARGWTLLERMMAAVDIMRRTPTPWPYDALHDLLNLRDEGTALQAYLHTNADDVRRMWAKHKADGKPLYEFAREERDTARAEAARLHDLVRHQRGALHDAGLLTDEEYAALAADHGAVARLEGYDAMRAERDAYRDRAVEHTTALEQQNIALLRWQSVASDAHVDHLCAIVRALAVSDETPRVLRDLSAMGVEEEIRRVVAAERINREKSEQAARESRKAAETMEGRALDAERERDTARRMLAECSILSGADTDGNTLESGWEHLWSSAVADVRDLRKDYDEACMDTTVETARDAALIRVRELEATLANERGEGTPPSEGWIGETRGPGVGHWIHHTLGFGVQVYPHEYLIDGGLRPCRVWLLAYTGGVVIGEYPTAREAMRDAVAALSRGPA